MSVIQNQLSQVIFLFFRIIKWPVFIISLLLLFPALSALFNMIIEMNANFSSDTSSYFFDGALLFLPFWLLFYFFGGKRWSEITTFEHEITHGIFAILSFQRIHNIVVHSLGGYMRPESGGIPNWLIFLAPYIFPTLSVPVIMIMVFSGSNAALEALLGFTLMYHFQSTGNEFHINQTDLTNRLTGLIFSLPVVVVTNLIIYTLIFALVLGGSEYSMVKLNEIFSALTPYISYFS